MIQNPMRRKIKDIRHLYGSNAADHFSQFPQCKQCGEVRIVCLTIHHVGGRSIDAFDTLCLNCHALVHAHRAGAYTAEDFRAENRIRLLGHERRQGRNLAIRKAVESGLSLRKTAKMYGVSHVLVWQITRDLALPSSA
jgi:hypothetical protein